MASPDHSIFMTLDMKNSVRQLPKIKCFFGMNTWMIFSTSIEQERICTTIITLWRKFDPFKHVISNVPSSCQMVLNFFLNPKFWFWSQRFCFNHNSSLSLSIIQLSALYTFHLPKNVCIFYFPKVTPSAVKSNSYDVGVLHASNSIFSENY